MARVRTVHRSRTSRTVTALLTLLLAALVPAPLGAQTGNVVRMHTTLEKTFLKVDMLDVDICVDDGTAARVSSLLTLSDRRAADDSIALAVVDAPEALARITFRRGVSLSQFLEGIAEEQADAVKAGWLDDSTRVAVQAALPGWYAFLETRGISSGDEITYLITADTVRTVYRSVERDTLLDIPATGQSRRRSVMASWLAPGMSTRMGLLSSLRKQTAGNPEGCRP